MTQCQKIPIAKEFLAKHNWPTLLNNERFDKCYCEMCYPSNLKDTLLVGGKMYVVPRGYTRIGFQIDEAHANFHNIWKDWNNCFHGTCIRSAKSIVASRNLLLPGDETMDGKEIKVRPGHIRGENYFFTSPTVKYASLPTYASSYDFKSPSDQKDYNVTVVIQCKQKPDSFIVQPETIAAGPRRICPFIKNDIIEWKTKQRNTIIPYGLLLLIDEVRTRKEARLVRRSSLKEMHLEEQSFLFDEYDTDDDFEQVECPNCYHLHDWMNPDENQGIIIKCSHRGCKKTFRPFSCPHCDIVFSYCTKIYPSEATSECTLKCVRCNKKMLSRNCPHCSVYSICRIPKNNQTVGVNCSSCNTKYHVASCPHCGQNKNIVGNREGEGTIVRCKNCSNKYALSNCASCSNVNVRKIDFDIINCAYRGCDAILKPVGDFATDVMRKLAGKAHMYELR